MLMREFGSDFHRCDQYFRGASNFCDMMGDVRWYACGRHAIDAIVRHGGWKRIWMPAYFCYEVISHLKEQFEVELYDDNPLNSKDDEVVRLLPYREGDVLLRTDYFGLRKWRTNEGIEIPVIEDHTHGLITDWALRSDADYCVASLRKSLPVAAGGILWSPKEFHLPDAIDASAECLQMAAIRFQAMTLKGKYLKEVSKCQYDSIVSSELMKQKNAFRKKYIDSEEHINRLVLSGIDHESEKIAKALNVKLWTGLKAENWCLCKELLDKRFKVIEPESGKIVQPFSLILLMETAKERERLRRYMIQHQIYPAILWQMPDDNVFAEAKYFSDRMLSVHCDIRYNREDVKKMCNIINGFYDTDI